MSGGCNTFPCLFRPKLHHHHPIQRTSCTSRPPEAALGERGLFLSRHQTLMADSHLYLLQVRLQSNPVNPAFVNQATISFSTFSETSMALPNPLRVLLIILSGFSRRYRETGRGRNGISIYEMERNLRTAASYLSHSLALFSSLRMPKSRFCRFGTTGGDETETDTTLKHLVPQSTEFVQL